VPREQSDPEDGVAEEGERGAVSTSSAAPDQTEIRPYGERQNSVTRSEGDEQPIRPI
jgi:hypothetical protein